MMTPFVDRELECKDCHQPFTFTSGEQQFFASKSLQDPVRCKACRAIKRAQRDGQAGQGPSPSPAPARTSGPTESNGRQVVIDMPPQNKGNGRRRNGGGPSDHRGGGGRRRDFDGHYDD